MKPRRILFIIEERGLILYHVSKVITSNHAEMKWEFSLESNLILNCDKIKCERLAKQEVERQIQMDSKTVFIENHAIMKLS